MSDFVTYVENDLFVEFGEVICRKMFGGYGLFHKGLMFGLIADDTLYLKVDSSTVNHFQRLNLEQFSYPKGGKLIKMSYYQAPENIFEDSEEARLWASRAYASAEKAKRK